MKCGTYKLDMSKKTGHAPSGELSRKLGNSFVFAGIPGESSRSAIAMYNELKSVFLK